MIPEKIVRKSHIACLNSWDVAYISVGQLQLMPIGFKLKFNKDESTRMVMIKSGF